MHKIEFVIQIRHALKLKCSKTIKTLSNKDQFTQWSSNPSNLSKSGTEQRSGLIGPDCCPSTNPRPESSKWENFLIGISNKPPLIETKTFRWYTVSFTSNFIRATVITLKLKLLTNLQSIYSHFILSI